MQRCLLRSMGLQILQTSQRTHLSEGKGLGRWGLSNPSHVCMLKPATMGYFFPIYWAERGNGISCSGSRLILTGRFWRIQIKNNLKKSGSPQTPFFRILSLTFPEEARVLLAVPTCWHFFLSRDEIRASWFISHGERIQCFCQSTRKAVFQSAGSQCPSGYFTSQSRLQVAPSNLRWKRHPPVQDVLAGRPGI